MLIWAIFYGTSPIVQGQAPRRARVQLPTPDSSLGLYCKTRQEPCGGSGHTRMRYDQDSLQPGVAGINAF